MARYVPRTYKNRRAARIVIRTLVFILLAALVLAVTMFFGLRRYIVYTPDGLRLELSWLEDSNAGDDVSAADTGVAASVAVQ
ncbi:MAG: hypothetical protein LBH17_08195 [Oscillospiraceae bacterium]|nr:hypothetical protein [Oscillospiraceae bacterium]